MPSSTYHFLLSSSSFPDSNNIQLLIMTCVLWKKVLQNIQILMQQENNLIVVQKYFVKALKAFLNYHVSIK